MTSRATLPLLICGLRPNHFFVASPDSYRDSLSIFVATLRSSFCSLLSKYIAAYPEYSEESHSCTSCIPITILSCGRIFDVKNLNTDDTGLTDKQRFFSALLKNLDRFIDPPSCEAGKSRVYPILKGDY
jgi:hypothetical protein